MFTLDVKVADHPQADSVSTGLSERRHGRLTAHYCSRGDSSEAMEAWRMGLEHNEAFDITTLLHNNTNTETVF